MLLGSCILPRAASGYRARMEQERGEESAAAGAWRGAQRGGEGYENTPVEAPSSHSSLAPTLTPHLSGLGLMMKCSEPGSSGWRLTAKVRAMEKTTGHSQEGSSRGGRGRETRRQSLSNQGLERRGGRCLADICEAFRLN